MAKFILGASTYITASGENTTFQLTPPGEKTTGDFQAGRIQDDENPTDAVDLGEDKYTEIEFCIQPTDEAEVGETYEFRLTKSDLWLPTDIGGNILFLRSTELVTKDEVDRVSQHGDQQTVGPYNFTQTTDAKKPVYFANQLDGYPSIRLDGIDDLITNGPISSQFNAGPFSMFWVAKRISITGYEWWAIATTEGARPIMDFIDYYGDYTIRRLDGGMVGGGVPDTNWHYFVLTYSGTNVTLRVDGSAVIDNAALNAPLSGFDIMSIGARSYNLTEMGHQNIEYTDWAAYNVAISAGDITLLENYAHARYPSI